MKNIFFTVIISLFSPLLWAFSTTELTHILQKPSNVQGSFTQQRYLKSLSKPMTTSGKFVLIPKNGLLWQMQKPFESTLRVRADGIQQWNGRSWIATTSSKMSGQNQQIKLFLDLLSGNTQGLETQFDLQLTGAANNWTLKLQPKTLLMKQIFNHIEINGDHVVRKIELNEKQGDRSIMQFNQIQTSSELNTFVKQAL